jgi:hypothetical protein
VDPPGISTHLGILLFLENLTHQLSNIRNLNLNLKVKFNLVKYRKLPCLGKYQNAMGVLT